MSSRFRRTREDFDCGNCGNTVHGNGYTNHCPRCLWSRHVDVAPGDRAADCGGLMRPVAALADGAGFIIVQRCEQCGHQWRNKSAAEDSRAAIFALFGRPVPDQGTAGRGRSGRRPGRS